MIKNPLRLIILALGPIVFVLICEAAMTRASADTVAAESHASPAAIQPRNSASVYWVGHSLVEGKAQTSNGEIDLMRLVERFAKEKGFNYKAGDHTLWGSSMSALWRGRPHSYDWDARAMVPRREAFEKDPTRFDTLVITEGIPLGTLEMEYSAYYLRRFACTLLRAVSQPRILLYQTWVHFHGSDPNGKYGPAHLFDWRAAMAAQRQVWEKLADQASKPPVRSPGGLLSYIGVNSSSDGGCVNEFPVFIVPVGNAFLALDSRLASPQPSDVFNTADGRRITTGDLFGNTFVDWPKDWPLAEGTPLPDLDQQLRKLTLRDTSRNLDDIHMSELGIYFAALVHFASIYQQPPSGLTYPDWIGAEAARTFECIAWETVTSDPRSGVTSRATC